MNSKTTEQAAEECHDYRANAVKYTCKVLHNYPTDEWVKIRDAYEAGHEDAQSTITSLHAEVERLKALVPVWVSVEDRLPTKGQRCIVLLRYNGFQDIKIDMFKESFDYYNVIHWMPLPSPPTNPEA